MPVTCRRSLRRRQTRPERQRSTAASSSGTCPTGGCVGTLDGHPGRVTDMTLSPDRTTAVSASRDQTLRLWDIAGGRRGRVLTGHTAWVTSVTWSPDGKAIASGSVDRLVCLWRPVESQSAPSGVGE